VVLTYLTDQIEAPDSFGSPSTTTDVADCYGNALAETINGLYKAESVYGPDGPAPCNDVGQLELETRSWVHWFNEHRLHSHCDDIPPEEFEAAFYAAQQTTPTGAGKPSN